jgi:hypothetical protein
MDDQALLVGATEQALTEIKVTEGLLRHIYRSDPRANRLNAQWAFAKLRSAGRTEPHC